MCAGTVLGSCIAKDAESAVRGCLGMADDKSHASLGSHRTAGSKGSKGSKGSRSTRSHGSSSRGS